MDPKHVINRIIAADDLHYYGTEKRFAALSQEEMAEIVSKCAESGITDKDDVYKVVRWYCGVRIGEILYRSFLSGQLKVTGFVDDEPTFAPSDTLAEDNLDDLDA
jgi:hypothetical protein